MFIGVFARFIAEDGLTLLSEERGALYLFTDGWSFASVTFVFAFELGFGLKLVEPLRLGLRNADLGFEPGPTLALSGVWVLAIVGYRATLGGGTRDEVEVDEERLSDDKLLSGRVGVQGTREFLLLSCLDDVDEASLDVVLDDIVVIVVVVVVVVVVA